MLKLVVLRGARAGQTFSSAEDTVRLGRAEGNDVVLPDEHISSDHARFAVVGPACGPFFSRVEPARDRADAERLADACTNRYGVPVRTVEL